MFLFVLAAAMFPKMISLLFLNQQPTATKTTSHNKNEWLMATCHLEGTSPSTMSLWDMICSLLVPTKDSQHCWLDCKVKHLSQNFMETRWSLEIWVEMRFYLGCKRPEKEHFSGCFFRTQTSGFYGWELQLSESTQVTTTSQWHMGYEEEEELTLLSWSQFSLLSGHENGTKGFWMIGHAERESTG